LPDDLRVFVSVVVGEHGTPGQGHIHATVTQRNVHYNPLLKVHLDNVVNRKRVGLICKGESAAHSGSVLSKTVIFPTKEGKKREISNESAQCSPLRQVNV